MRPHVKEDPRLFGGTLRGGRWCTDSGVSLVEPEGFPPLGNLPRHRLFGAVGSAPPTKWGMPRPEVLADGFCRPEICCWKPPTRATQCPVRMKYLFSFLSICLQCLSQYSNHLALCTLQVPRDPAPVQYSVLYWGYRQGGGASRWEGRGPVPRGTVASLPCCPASSGTGNVPRSASQAPV